MAALKWQLWTQFVCKKLPVLIKPETQKQEGCEDVKRWKVQDDLNKTQRADKFFFD